MLVSAPVLINPMTGTGLWNLEWRIDILSEGLGMVETWLTFWTIEMTEISSKSEDSAIMKVVWSSCFDCSKGTMLKMLYETNSFGILVRTVSSKVIAFLADEITIMLFLYVLWNIFFLKYRNGFLEDDFLWKCFWKCFIFLVQQTHFFSSLHSILRWGFLQALEKGFLFSMRSLKNFFCSQILSRHNISI